uniref:Uncharacterized protein n=1 Tax=Plectus sambesii TaxID=2011161 RepID=A0A914VA44_9BILA
MVLAMRVVSEVRDDGDRLLPAGGAGNDRRARRAAVFAGPPPPPPLAAFARSLSEPRFLLHRRRALASTVVAVVDVVVVVAVAVAVLSLVARCTAAGRYDRSRLSRPPCSSRSSSSNCTPIAILSSPQPPQPSPLPPASNRGRLFVRPSLKTLLVFVVARSLSVSCHLATESDSGGPPERRASFPSLPFEVTV